jgi:hypothetical protein
VYSKKDIVFVLTREDVVECARETCSESSRTMGIPEEAITDDVVRMVKKGVDNGLRCWPLVVKEAINFALKS